MEQPPISLVNRFRVSVSAEKHPPNGSSAARDPAAVDQINEFRID
jgi:hypothetical protein